MAWGQATGGRHRRGSLPELAEDLSEQGEQARAQAGQGCRCRPMAACIAGDRVLVAMLSASAALIGGGSGGGGVRGGVGAAGPAATVWSRLGLVASLLSPAAGVPDPVGVPAPAAAGRRLPGGRGRAESACRPSAQTVRCPGSGGWGGDAAGGGGAVLVVGRGGLGLAGKARDGSTGGRRPPLPRCHWRFARGAAPSRVAGAGWPWGRGPLRSPGLLHGGAFDDDIAGGAAAPPRSGG